jgi:hypothetical protein
LALSESLALIPGSPIVLINLASEDTDATQLRSSLIALRRETSDKLMARKAQRKIKEAQQIAAKYAYVPTIPHGGVLLQS